MKSLLILRHIKVENANAIGGLTYGFPAISNFLGFTHALSRALQKTQGLTLGGCAVVCHHHSVQAYQPTGWGDYVFALTRNPLTKESKSPAFVEEGRMHMDVTLLIECDFDVEAIDFDTGVEKQDIALFESWANQQALSQRLAGGTIREIEGVVFSQLPEGSEDLSKHTRKLLLRLLPGFVLVDRKDLLNQHFHSRKEENPETELIDAWLDFVALKYQAEAIDLQEGEQPTSEHKAKWNRIPKPASGWLVPISTGFKAISPLYEHGQVARTRDPETPFRFVESIYSIGEWISPHRINDLPSIFWRYHYDGDWYLCDNPFGQQPLNKQ